jgi:regulator of sigma E protease
LDLCLIAEIDIQSKLALLWVILQVAAGLGFVIFVHELGHFLVAKACGVQCDKFYIGFDPPISLPIIGRLPSALFKKKWGETEYGIGIIPLGGYVKMLGQDDNPANAAEEMRKARVYKEKQAAGTEHDATASEVVAAASTLGDLPEEPHAHEAGEPEYVLNPRSYLAKSVPQRMAIISAGVIMNVIFAFIFATIAYSIGVKYTPCVIAHVVPGSPAWDAGLLAGEEIIQIGSKDKLQFRDLRQEITLGDMENGVVLVVKTPGKEETHEVTLIPSKETKLPTIGITQANSLTFFKELKTDNWGPVPAAKAGFEGHDEIVAINGKPVTSYTELQEMLTKYAEKPIEVTVLRGAEEPASNVPGDRVGGEKVTLKVDANPMKRLGLEMRIGQITNVQKGSPAEKAGLKPGDYIERLDNEAVGDPMTLPDRLFDRAVQKVPAVLGVRRNSEAMEFTVQLREPTWYESSFGNAPMSAPALGISYRVLNSVLMVEPNSPAAKAKVVGKNAGKTAPGMLAADIVMQAELIPAKGDTSELATELAKKPIVFSKPEQTNDSEVAKGESSWPGFVMYQLQTLPAGMTVKLTVKRGNEELQFEMQPEASEKWFNPDRGFALEPLELIRKGATLGESAELGFRETKYAMGAVYRFLRKLGTQIPITALGGPLTIAQGAGYSAFHGFPTLLIFLTLLSANLAVVNFLPIPLLDGGHMVLLTLEGIMRRPVSEKIVGAFQMVGFAFILGLMLLVLTLDLGRLGGYFQL